MTSPSSGLALRAGSDPAAASCEPMEGHISLRFRSLGSRGRPRNSRRSSALRERVWRDIPAPGMVEPADVAPAAAVAPVAAAPAAGVAPGPAAAPAAMPEWVPPPKPWEPLLP